MNIIKCTICNKLTTESDSNPCDRIECINDNLITITNEEYINILYPFGKPNVIEDINQY